MSKKKGKRKFTDDELGIPGIGSEQVSKFQVIPTGNRRHISYIREGRMRGDAFARVNRLNQEE